MLSACVTFDETHHFKTVDAEGEAVNYFRIKVTGSAKFSSARYVSGFYDERAVDLFFNEIKSRGKDDPVDKRPLFPTTIPAGLKIEPLSQKDGTFVMILSTNADEVASTIGAFAEGNVAGDMIARLINREAYQREAKITAELAAKDRQSATLVNEIQFLLDRLKADDPVAAKEDARRALGTIALGLGRTTPFATFDQARSWFEEQRP